MTFALLILLQFSVSLKTIWELGAHVQCFAPGPQSQTLEDHTGTRVINSMQLCLELFFWLPCIMWHLQKNGTPVKYMIYLAIIFSILVLLDGEVRRRRSYLHTSERVGLGLYCLATLWVVMVIPWLTLPNWPWPSVASARPMDTQVCEMVYAPSSQLIVSPPPVWEHEQQFDRVLKDWKRDWSLLLRPNLSILSITSQKRPLVISYVVHRCSKDLQRTELTSLRGTLCEWITRWKGIKVLNVTIHFRSMSDPPLPQIRGQYFSFSCFPWPPGPLKSNDIFFRLHQNVSSVVYLAIYWSRRCRNWAHLLEKKLKTTFGHWSLIFFFFFSICSLCSLENDRSLFACISLLVYKASLPAKQTLWQKNKHSSTKPLSIP